MTPYLFECCFTCFFMLDVFPLVFIILKQVLHDACSLFIFLKYFHISLWGGAILAACKLDCPQLLQ